MKMRERILSKKTTVLHFILIFYVLCYEGKTLKLNVAFLHNKVGENEGLLALKLAERRLKNEGVLPNDTQLKIISQRSCSDSELRSFESVTDIVQLRNKQPIDLIIGPEQESCMVPVAHLAAEWNIPMIAYESAELASNKTIFPTLTCLHAELTNIAHAVCHLLEHYKWQISAVVYDERNSESILLKERFIDAANLHHFQVSVVACGEKNIDEVLTELKSTTRVVLIALQDNAELFLSAANKQKMSVDNGYVFIIPSTSDTGQPPVDLSTETNQQLYNGTFLITREVGDEQVTSNFTNQLKLAGLNDSETKEHHLLPYIHDSLYIYGQVVGEFMGSNMTHKLNDGRAVSNELSGRFFDGASGPIWLDSENERVTSYLAKYVSNVGQLDTVIIMTIVQVRCTKDCQKLMGPYDGEIYYDLKSEIVDEHFWVSPGGINVVPKDKPECGFSDEFCETTTNRQLWTGFFVSLVIIAAVCVGVGVFSYKKLQQRRLFKMAWRIHRHNIKSIDAKEEASSLKSLSRIHDVDNEEAETVEQAMINGDVVIIRRYKQKRTLNFTKQDLNQLNFLKSCHHDNLNLFVGLCFNEDRGSSFFIIWNSVTRGSLEGLDYILRSPIQAHGALTMANCLVDSHWSVKLCDFGFQPLLMSLVSLNVIRYNKGSLSDLLHVAPELLNDNRTGPFPATQAGDMYSLGMVLYEILYRIEPFSDNYSSIAEVMNMVSNRGSRVQPSIPKTSTVHPDVIKALQGCWKADPTERMDLKRVRRLVEHNLQKDSTGLVDHMVTMMDRYAKNLEKLVKERTAMLEDAQKKADELLYRLLPKSVAEELKAGRTVLPQMFPSVTVYFSDLVGFTSLCSESRPMEIVDFLNELFSGYDEIIARHDIYKVETIGDAYMCASGVPKANGGKHAAEIAEMSLEIVQHVTTFKLKHKPSRKLLLRSGFHSGPVATGVIGLSAPKYCLFGDTVNTASRMESTGKAMKVQISGSSRDLLVKWPKFSTTMRGMTAVKGKGELVTYWLEWNQ